MCRPYSVAIVEINEPREDEARAAAQDSAVSAETAGAASAVGGIGTALKEQKAAVAIGSTILASAYA